MDFLQSFMGCLYPGSIRTESIESMDHYYPDCRYQVANIDERGNEVSRGELQLTDRDLIYFRPSRVPTRWPIGYIRRYGCSEQRSIFLFEAGRRCPTGEAIFAFRLSRGSELVDRLREKIEKFPTNESYDEQETPPSDDIISKCCLNGRPFSPPNSIINHRLSSTAQASSNQQVPHLSGVELSKLTSNNQRKKDASTTTDNNQAVDLDHHLQNSLFSGVNQEGADPRPLSYAQIDFDTTRALNESAQAHAASRVR